MRFKQPHTSTYKGKTVIIIKRDGTRITDKFKDKKSKYVMLEKHGIIYNSDIRSFMIRRGQHGLEKQNV